MLSSFLLLSIGTVFGADQIAANTIYQLQKEAPNLMIYLLPIVFLFTIIEFGFSHFGQHKTYESKETIGSLFIGIGNLAVNLLLKTALLMGAIWVYNLLPWRMELNWYTLIFCFLVYDFCSYWSHRISHYNRFFWATHVVHHSANHYNLTVAFRQSWVQHFKTIFFIPVALMGFHPIIFFVASQLSTLYQFWVHTEAIGKLHPWIEKYFGTPSNHRVHHGSQEKYLDKNFGATLMIWDHLFGSFQYEEEKPIYGLTTPIKAKTNPLTLNFHEYQDMLKDLKQSTGTNEMLFFIFGSPGKIAAYKLNRTKTRSRYMAKFKKTLIRAAVIATIFVLGLTAFVNAQYPSALPMPKGKNLLFFLQRTPDANTVIYEVNYKRDGTIDAHSPVKASWIRYEENGIVKDLTGVEKKFAYGVKCRAIGNGDFEIRLTGYQKMPMYLLKSADQKYQIYIRDEGKNFLLKRVFIKVNGGTFWFPKVQYIDLFTINSDNGMELLKRINID